MSRDEGLDDPPSGADGRSIGLSARGRMMVAGGMSPYVAAHVERQGQAGYTGLCVAENLQVFPLLQERLQRFPPVPRDVVAYDEMGGRADLRRAVASLLGQHVVGRPVDPDHVRVLAGAGSVLDALGHALADPGDAVIVPTPSYAGFWPDLEIRPGLQIVAAPTDPADGFRITRAVLDRALGAAGGRARILLLTNPDNPRGRLVDTEDLEGALRFAEEHDLHVIADEVYALSTFGDQAFTSVGRLRPRLGERVHLVWGFSKDFGMSGLRCGVLVTEDAALRQAVDVQASWGGVSGHTQHVLTAMLEDTAWVTDFLHRMRAGLARTAGRVMAALDARGLAHVRPEAGFFLLVDLRDHLAQPTWDAEDALWRTLLEDAGVNLTPGSALRAPDPGWFRLCYASTPEEEVLAAIDRVGAVLRGGAVRSGRPAR